MNDRHRTIARYKKRHCKKEDPYFFLNDLGKRLAPAIEHIYNGLFELAQAALDALKKFTEDIKSMPIEEFKETIAKIKPELTPEQLAILEKIRGDGNNERPNSETKSMGE